MACAAPLHMPGMCYAQLETALNTTLMHLLGDISGLPRMESYQRAQSILSDILSITNAALASFGRAWNDVQRDPIAVLPSELMSACFWSLDLRSRISVSHVSKAWRNAALSDRSLWSEYTVSADDRDTDAGLRAMLSRSDPLRFRLTWAADLSDELVGYIGLHMHRIQVLRLEVVQHDAVQRLVEHDAPLLEKFRYRKPKEPSDIPLMLRWSTSYAPCLRKVTVERFLIPPGSVFGAIQVFDGTLPDGGTFPGPLAFIFPALTELVLNEVNQISLEPLATLPSTLKAVVLNSAEDAGPLDYSQFLKACHALELSYLYIHCTDSVSGVAGLAARHTDRPWSMRLSGDTYLNLGTSGCDYEIDCHQLVTLLREPVIMAHLHHLGDLSLSLFEYGRLYQFASWPRALPALTRFTLIMEHPDALRRAHIVFVRTPIATPALQSIEIRAGERSAFKNCPPLSHFVPVVRSLAVPCLRSLTLCVHCAESLVPADAACLSGLAQRVSVRDFRYDGVAAIVLETSDSSS